MDIKIERTFYPVGHGCFSTEVYQIGTDKEKKVVVYDCGSMNRDIVEKCVNEHVKVTKCKTIDLLIISHFHYDHISGIKHLFDNKIEIKKVLIPIFSRAEIRMFTLQLINDVNSVEELQSCAAMIYRPGEYFGKNTEVIYFDGSIQDQPDAEYTIGSLDTNIILKNGNNILLKEKEKGELNWIIKPYFYHDEKLEQEQSKIITKIITDLEKIHNVSIELLIKALENNAIDLIEKLFKELIKKTSKRLPIPFRELSKNENSLVVYSGFNKSYQSINLVIDNKVYTSYQAGCIYFGDYKTNYKKRFKPLYNTYKNIWKLISSIQVPHHGSHSFFNKKLLLDNCFNFIIFREGDEKSSRLAKLPDELMSSYQSDRYKVEICSKGNKVVQKFPLNNNIQITPLQAYKLMIILGLAEES